MNKSVKVQPYHQKRGTYLNVPQSSMPQVLENTESTKRQYALRGRTIALGWRQEQITVIDNDQAESGALATWREDFQYLFAEPGLGRTGTVMGLDVSRLPKDCVDW
jgi:hypothetical protein